MEDFMTDDPCHTLYMDFENIKIQVKVPDGEVYQFLVNGTRFEKVSSFFEGYSRYQTDRTTCSLCQHAHSYTTLCIPAYFDPEAIACIINLINGCIPSSQTPVDFIAVIRIAGFLLINENWLRDNLFSNGWFSTNRLYRQCAVMFELYRNGYFSLVDRYAKRIQLPLLRQHRSLRSFYRHCRRLQRRDRGFVQFKNPNSNVNSPNNPWATRHVKGYHGFDDFK